MLRSGDATRSREHELRVLASAGPDGLVRVNLSTTDDETPPAEFTLSFTLGEVEAGVATAKGLSEQAVARRRQELPADPLREAGRRLFDAVFQGRGKALYDRCRDRAREAGVGLRVRVVLPPADHLHLLWLPWEFLYDSRRRDFLALSAFSPVVRDVGRPPPPLDPITGPVRVLVAGADVTGERGVAEEIGKLKKVAARNRQRLSLSVLPAVTRSQLLAAVREREYHVLHVIGTGPAKPTGDELTVWPEPAGDGESLPGPLVGADELAEAVSANGGVLVVILDAWHTDRLAARLAERVPATVGLRGAVSVPACMAFALELYRASVRGEPLDGAVTLARRQVDHRLTGSREWGLLTVYLQTPDGVFTDWPDDRNPAFDEAVGQAWEAGRSRSHGRRKVALVRAVCERNRQALEELIERSDGQVPEVVREQLRVLRARLKSNHG